MFSKGLISIYWVSFWDSICFIISRCTTSTSILDWITSVIFIQSLTRFKYLSPMTISRITDRSDFNVFNYSFLWKIFTSRSSKFFRFSRTPFIYILEHIFICSVSMNPDYNAFILKVSSFSLLVKEAYWSDDFSSSQSYPCVSRLAVTTTFIPVITAWSIRLSKWVVLIKTRWSLGANRRCH